MSSFDLRTRDDGEHSDFDARDFLDEELPTLLEAKRALLSGAERLRLRALRVRTDSGTWTLERRGDRHVVERGDGPERERVAEIRLSDARLGDLVADRITPIGIMTAGTLDLRAGSITDVLDWWLVMRSVLDDRPVYEPGTITVATPPGRSFTLADDPAELSAALGDAGYLHLKGVFSAAEMEQISRDMDAAVPSYSPGDGRSWWAGTGDGSNRLVRMQAFETRSDAAAALLDDPRFVALGDVPGCGHTNRGLENNLIEALFKPTGVVSGISDVPWHKDCSLGRHSYECCSVTAGISVTGAGPGSGQLRVAAGSHRALMWPSLIDPVALGLADVALPTDTGDVTLHLSCTLHMAEPPLHTERRVLYTSFGLPVLDPAATAAARRALNRESRERAPLTTDQPTSAR